MAFTFSSLWKQRRGAAEWSSEDFIAKMLGSARRDVALGLNPDRAVEHALGTWDILSQQRRGRPMAQEEVEEVMRRLEEQAPPARQGFLSRWFQRLAAHKFLPGEVLLVTEDFKAQSENHHLGVFAVIPKGAKIVLEQVYPNAVHFAPVNESGDKYDPPSFPTIPIKGGEILGMGNYSESHPAYRFSISPRKLVKVTSQISPGEEPPLDPDAIKSDGNTDGFYSQWSTSHATDNIVESYKEQLKDGLPGDVVDGWDKHPWMLKGTDFEESYAVAAEPGEWLKNVEVQGLMSKLDSVLRGKAYEDTDMADQEWDSFKKDLTNLMENIAPGNTVWRVNMRGFGWMKEDNDGTVTAKDGEELLYAVLPKTDCSFRIYREGKGIKINNAHHDVPMGGEMYYITPFDAPPPNPAPTSPEVQKAVAPEMWEGPTVNPLTGRESPGLREHHEQQRQRSRPKDKPQPKTQFSPEQLEQAPSAPFEVPTLKPGERQLKLDHLLDQYSTESDPVKKQQLEQRIRSLSASLFGAGWFKRYAGHKDWSPSFLFDPVENPVPFPAVGQHSGLWGWVYANDKANKEDGTGDLDELMFLVGNDQGLYNEFMREFSKKIPEVQEDGTNAAIPVKDHQWAIPFLKEHFEEINQQYVYPTWGKAEPEPGHENDPFYQGGNAWEGIAKDVITHLRGIYGEERGMAELEKFLARLKPGEREDFMEEAGEDPFASMMKGFQEIIDEQKAKQPGAKPRVKPSPKSEMFEEHVEDIPTLTPQDIEKRKDAALDRFSKGEITHEQLDQEIKRLDNLMAAAVGRRVLANDLLMQYAEGRITQTEMEQRLAGGGAL